MRPIRISLVLAVLLVLAPIGAKAGTAHSDEYHPHTVLVAFDTGILDATRASAHAVLGGSVVNTFDWLNMDVVWLPDGVDPAVAAARYEALAGVAHASVNKKIRAHGVPNDVLFRDQWGFHNTGQRVTGSLVTGIADADIDAPEGWTGAFGATSFESSGGTRVAVLDTGIDRGHVEFLNKVKACAGATSATGIVVANACDDDGAHGTHTAGTVAATTNNNVGVAGTAPNAELAIFKFLNAAGVGFLADEIAGLRWAYTTGQAKVFSMSYGAYDPDGAEQQALRDAQNAGVLLVAASGNDYDSTLNYPAAYPEVMSVASTNAADAISDFANCNNDVEIAAPGEDVWSTTPGNSYAVLSGTSMATPHIAGVAALVMSEKGLSASQTRNQIISTSTSVASTGGRSACNGIKKANLAGALGAIAPPPPPPAPGAIAGTVSEQKGGPLAAATVNCGAAGSTTTASDGTYSLTNVPVGTYSCTASKTGYVSKTSNVSVFAGTTTTADFTLRKQR